MKYLTKYPFKNMKSVRTLNQWNGYHFFAEDTLKFFSSRVYDKTFTPVEDGALFVTSEQQEPLFLIDRDKIRNLRTEWAKYDRRYTVRFAACDGTIQSVGDDGFQKYSTRTDAIKALQTYAEKGRK